MKSKKSIKLKNSYWTIKKNQEVRIFPTNEKPNDKKLWEAHKKAMELVSLPMKRIVVDDRLSSTDDLPTHSQNMVEFPTHGL